MLQEASKLNYIFYHLATANVDMAQVVDIRSRWGQNPVNRA